MTDYVYTFIVLFKVIPIMFQAVQNHHGKQRTSEESLNYCIINALYALFIGLKVSAKFSYRADADNSKILCYVYDSLSHSH